MRVLKSNGPLHKKHFSALHLSYFGLCFVFPFFKKRVLRHFSCNMADGIFTEEELAEIRTAFDKVNP